MKNIELFWLRGRLVFMELTFLGLWWLKSVLYIKMTLRCNLLYQHVLRIPVMISGLCPRLYTVINGTEYREIFDTGTPFFRASFDPKRRRIYGNYCLATSSANNSISSFRRWTTCHVQYAAKRSIITDICTTLLRLK